MPRLSYSLPPKNRPLLGGDSLLKYGIYHSEKFLQLIVLHSDVDAYSCLAVFMSSKILDRLGSNASIQKIGDVGMPQQVRCYIEA